MNPNINPGAIFYSTTQSPGTQQITPTDQNGGAAYFAGGGGGGGWGPSTSATPALTVDPSVNQYYDQLTAQANSQLNRLPTQLQVGQANIANAFNQASNNLNTSRSQAQRNYNTASGQALQNETQNEGDINFNTGMQTNALQRLLGAAGFGSSLAALQGVPYATGLAGQQQLRASQQAYGRNQQALDTNWNDYLQGFNNSMGQLQQQRTAQNNALQSSIDQNKASLLQQLANIAQQRAGVQPGATYADVVAAAQPYYNQVNALGGQIDQLAAQYANPVIAANSPAYQPPTLENYIPQVQTAQIGVAPGAGSNLGYFTNLLLNGQQQQQQQNLAGQPVAG